MEKIMEKSGKFVSQKRWERWVVIFMRINFSDNEFD